MIVIRHGEGTHNVGNFYSGDPSQPSYIEANLTQKGKSQVADTGERLLKQVIMSTDLILQIVCSPLPRTIETGRALIATLSLPDELMIIDKRATESSLGAREGHLLSQYPDKDPWFPDNPSAFGGETQEQVQTRMIELYNHLVTKHKDQEGIVIIISHGAPLYLLIKAVTGRDNRLAPAGYDLLPMRPL